MSLDVINASTVTLPLVLLGGLLGSAHCIGMCGPFALMIGGAAKSWRVNAGRQVIYTIGRVCTYGTFGAVAGYGGYYLERQLPQLVNVAAVLAMAAGGFLVYQGLVAARVIRVNGGHGTCLWFGSYLAPLFRSKAVAPLFVAGLLTGLLPCGLVYGFLALAAASRDLLSGAAIMSVFGAGTAPVMILTGCGGSVLSGSMRQRLYWLAAWCVVLTGVFSFARGWAFFAATQPVVDTCPFCN